MSEPISPVLPNSKLKEIILGAGDTNAMPLPVYHNDQGYLSRWTFTDDELRWIAHHRCLYVHINSHVHPPLKLLAEAVGLKDNGEIVVIAKDDDPLERLAKL